MRDVKQGGIVDLLLQVEGVTCSVKSEQNNCASKNKKKKKKEKGKGRKRDFSNKTKLHIGDVVLEVTDTMMRNSLSVNEKGESCSPRSDPSVHLSKHTVVPLQAGDRRLYCKRSKDLPKGTIVAQQSELGKCDYDFTAKIAEILNDRLFVKYEFVEWRHNFPDVSKVAVITEGVKGISLFNWLGIFYAIFYLKNNCGNTDSLDLTGRLQEIIGNPDAQFYDPNSERGLEDGKCSLFDMKDPLCIKLGNESGFENVVSIHNNFPEIFALGQSDDTVGIVNNICTVYDNVVSLCDANAEAFFTEDVLRCIVNSSARSLMNSWELLEKYLSFESFLDAILLILLTGQTDGKPENYIVSSNGNDDGELVLIDPEIREASATESNDRFPAMSCLFLLGFMDKDISFKIKNGMQEKLSKVLDLSASGPNILCGDAKKLIAYLNNKKKVTAHGMLKVLCPELAVKAKEYRKRGGVFSQIYKEFAQSVPRKMNDSRKLAPTSNNGFFASRRRSISGGARTLESVERQDPHCGLSSNSAANGDAKQGKILRRRNSCHTLFHSQNDQGAVGSSVSPALSGEKEAEKSLSPCQNGVGSLGQRKKPKVAISIATLSSKGS